LHAVVYALPCEKLQAQLVRIFLLTRARGYYKCRVSLLRRRIISGRRMDAMVVASVNKAFSALPSLPVVLAHLGQLHPFAVADEPMDIAASWQGARDVAASYGVMGSSSLAVEDAAMHQADILHALRPSLSHALIARATEIDPATLNGERRVLGLTGDLVKYGVISPHAGHVLTESAAIALGVAPQQPLTSLAQLLKAATLYVKGTPTPNSSTIETLAEALAHHNVSPGLLEAYVDEGHTAELLNIPSFIREIENRLWRIVAHVPSEEKLRTQFGLTFDDISAAGAAGVISPPVVDGAWKILHEREELFTQRRHDAALSFAYAVTSATMGLVIFGLWLSHLGTMPPAEESVMRNLSWLCGGSALYNGIQCYLSPGRTKK
jgi:hypothetical protein